MSTQISKYVDDVFASVKSYVIRNIDPLVARIKAVEERAPIQGEKGDPGDKGEPGANGKDGVGGKSVDIDEVSTVLAVEVKRALEAIPAPKDGKSVDMAEVEGVVRAATERAVSEIPKALDGQKGEQGDKGERGEKGADAVVDFDAVVSAAAAKIPVGKDGAPGKDVDPLVVQALVVKTIGEIPKPADGRDGRDGEPGRDAFAIEVQHELDPTRRYQRGTWAKHAGGLWMARAATNGMDGWDCIVDGIASIGAIVAGDVRGFTLAVATSSGKSVELPFSVPAMVYHGIWKEGDAYQHGDTTTRDGSTWVLMADEQKGKPGDEDSGWQLAVKRGRDGKDGLKGEKGERGSEGRAGKDLTQLGPDGSRRW